MKQYRGGRVCRACARARPRAAQRHAKAAVRRDGPCGPASRYPSGNSERESHETTVGPSGLLRDCIGLVGSANPQSMVFEEESMASLSRLAFGAWTHPPTTAFSY